MLEVLVGENAEGLIRWAWASCIKLHFVSMHIKSLCIAETGAYAYGWKVLISVSNGLKFLLFFWGFALKILIIHYATLKVTEIIGFSVAYLHIYLANLYSALEPTF